MINICDRFLKESEISQYVEKRLLYGTLIIPALFLAELGDLLEYLFATKRQKDPFAGIFARYSDL